MVDVAAGGAHSACVTAAGDLYTWGKGRYGRLGHSDSEDQLKPKLVRRRRVQGPGAACSSLLLSHGAVCHYRYDFKIPKYLLF